MKRIYFKGFGGVQLSAESSGDATAIPVLLLHGGGQTNAAWRGVAEALVEAGRHVINLDLRGHGESEWPSDGRYSFDAYVEDVKAVLAQLPARPVVVAASLGGWIATVALGEEGAHLASALILVDAPPQLDVEISRSVGDALRRKAITKGSGLEWDPRFLEGFNVEQAMQTLNGAAAKLAIPVLFVRGQKSRLADIETAEAFVASIPNAEYAEVEGAGHLLVSERADAFNSILLDFLERRAPLTPPEYREGADARTFRDALGCFATGVTVITAMTPSGQPVGLTANSFTSLSLDPPLLLVCIAKSVSSAAVFETVGRFAVNVLQIGQQPTSNRFAGKSDDRFSATPWVVGEFGTPVLTGSLASFECAWEAVHDGGDHFILVGRALKAMFEPRRDPLLYFRGKYRRLHFA